MPNIKQDPAVSGAAIGAILGASEGPQGILIGAIAGYLIGAWIKKK